jgi:hypothetical protein
MLTANSTTYRQAWTDFWFEIADSGSAITKINCSTFLKEATFEIDKRFFRVLTVDPLELEFQLKFADTLIASATKQFFPEGILLTFGGREWKFRKKGLFAKKLSLVQNGAEAGTIVAGRWPMYFTGVTVDLPEQLPRTVQLFVLYIFLRWLIGSCSE